VSKQSLPLETTAALTTTPQVKRAAMAMEQNYGLPKNGYAKKDDAEKINKPSMEKPMLAIGGQRIPLPTGHAA
jgi:hypothetical protein